VLRLENLPEGREIRAVVEEATAVALAAVVVGGPGRGLPPLAREALRWAIEHAEASPQVSHLAAALGLTPRALLRELKAANGVTPRTLLLWGRLMRASHLLARSQETVESTAFRLGYATGATLRRAFKRHVGCGPTTLLRRGGLWWTLEVFQQKALLPQEGRRRRWANISAGRRRSPGNVGRQR
jgi:AraC-like DNA-binding protein